MACPGPTNCQAEPCTNPSLGAALLAIGAASQGIGVVLTIASLFVPNRSMEIRMGTARIRWSPFATATRVWGIAAGGGL